MFINAYLIKLKFILILIFLVIPKIREFEYEIEFESEAAKNNWDSCVTIYMMKKTFDTRHEMISLVFNLIFTPRKPFR
jgi:hypothetical protein